MAILFVVVFALFATCTIALEHVSLPQWSDVWAKYRSQYQARAVTDFMQCDFANITDYI